MNILKTKVSCALYSIFTLFFFNFSNAAIVSCVSCGEQYNTANDKSCPKCNTENQAEVQDSLIQLSGATSKVKVCTDCNRGYFYEHCHQCPHCKARNPKRRAEIALQSCCSAKKAKASPRKKASSQQRCGNSYQLKLSSIVLLFIQIAQSNIYGNFLFSPYSLSVGLSNLILGATGNTYDIIRQHLLGEGHPGEKSPHFNYAHSSDGNSHTFNSANCILVGNVHQLKESYCQQIRSSGSFIHSGINFKNLTQLQNLADEINGVISQCTNNKITSCCDPLEWHNAYHASLIVFAASYFYSQWRFRFENDPGQFTLPNGKIIHLDRKMRAEVESAHQAGFDGWVAVAIPYTSDYEMIVVLPPEGLAPLNITLEVLQSLLISLDETAGHDLAIEMPAFNVDSAINMRPYLDKIGLGVIFTQDSSYGGMVSSSQPVAIENFMQYTNINVDENGTEIIDLTVYDDEWLDACVPDTININRPFICMVRNTETKEIVYFGQISNPCIE